MTYARLLHSITPNINKHNLTVTEKKFNHTNRALFSQFLNYDNCRASMHNAV